MLQYLFDTDHLTLFEYFDLNVWRRFSTHLGGEVGLSAVSIEESLCGRLASIARHQGGASRVRASLGLLGSLQLFDQFTVVPFDYRAEAQFQQLRPLRIRIGTQDQRIAAVALVNNLILVSRNRRDFSRIPGLVLEDWSV
jgi:tRNA(fMet)-specific endonuclease VapC